MNEQRCGGQMIERQYGDGPEARFEREDCPGCQDCTPQRDTYIRLRPKIGGPYAWCYTPRGELNDLFSDGGSPEDYEIEEIKLTQEEWEALPEFEGW